MDKKVSASSLLILVVPAGIGLYFTSLWISYRRRISKFRRKGPTLNQLTNPYGILSGLQKYNREIWRLTPQIFKELDTPLFYLITSEGTHAHVNDAGLFHEICKKKSALFPKAVKLYDVLRIFGDNIVTTDGDVWRKHRRCSSAAFSEANNRVVFETSVATVRSMLQCWSRSRTAGGCLTVHILEETTQLTLAIISSAAFGMKIDVFDSGKEVSALKNVADSNAVSELKLTFTRCMELVSQNTLSRVLLPKWAFKIPFRNLPEIGLAYEEFDRYLLDVVNATNESVPLASRKAELHKDPDVESNPECVSQTSPATRNRRKQNLLVLLAQAGMQSEAEDFSVSAKECKLTTKEILGNAFIFMLAGHETSAHALSFAFILLAINPEEQEALFQDVKRVLCGSETERVQESDGLPSILYSDVEKLEYCNAVIREALRLFPPVVVVPKVAAQDCDITSSDGRSFHISEGTTVSLSIYSLHRNPAIYPDPEKFSPQRWIGKSKIDEGADSDASSIFAAFSLGSRSCIGRRFAEIELVVTLAMICLRYTVSIPEGVTTEHLLETKNLLTLYPANDDGLIFKERSTS